MTARATRPVSESAPRTGREETTDAGRPRERLTVAEALAETLRDHAPLAAPREERVPLAAAMGRVLAHDAVSPVALPPWDNASMDGWAVRAADVLGASVASPVALRVVGEVPAGARWAGTLGAGEAVRIATGAPLPAGADTVVRVEDSHPLEDARVALVHDRDARDATAAGGTARRNVRPRGEDVAAGAVVVARGTRLGAGALALLAATGHGRDGVLVMRRPRVAIVGSGDELLDPSDVDGLLAARGVVATNGLALAALVHAHGGEARDLGVVPDRPEALADALAGAVADGADLVLTTGGVSVGARDHARDAVHALGGTLRFWRVRVRPGGPLAMGTLPAPDGRHVPWLGLPGNPVSSMVTYELFARPLLALLAGDARLHARSLPAVLGEPVRTGAGLAHYLRATLHADAAGRTVARLTGAQGSGLLGGMARAEALVVVPEGTTALAAGAPVRVVPLGDATPRGAEPEPWALGLAWAGAAPHGADA